MYSLLRRRQHLLLIVCCALMLSACGANRPPSTITTPAGQSAWYARKAVLAFEALGDAAIGLNTIRKADGQPVLSLAQTTPIVTVSRDAIAALGKAPAGWRAVTTEALAKARSSLDASGRQELGQWLLLVEGILKEAP